MTPTQGQRLKAAMMLAGCASTTILADRIQRRRMGKGTLDRISSDKRPLEDYEAVWVADALGVVPVSWFFADDPAGAGRGGP